MYKIIYLTVILRGRAGYELIYITNEAVGRVGYYQLISGKSNFSSKHKLQRLLALLYGLARAVICHVIT